MSMTAAVVPTGVVAMSYAFQNHGIAFSQVSVTCMTGMHLQGFQNSPGVVNELRTHMQVDKHKQLHLKAVSQD